MLQEEKKVFVSDQEEGRNRKNCSSDDEEIRHRPQTEVIARSQRRSFSLKYKLHILEEADRCVKGELGALLRREGIYDSTYRQWLKQREKGILNALAPKRRGPTPKPVDPQAKQVAELERENGKLRRQLEKTEFIIEFQKKISALLGIDQTLPEERKEL
jgi:transposase-like protein